MSKFEYMVIPTPRRPKRAKGVKGEPARFANVLTEAINEIAAEGWEFYKTETLPMEAKPGLFSKRVEMFQSVMVFRRIEISAPADDEADNAGKISAVVAPVPSAAEPAQLTAIAPEPDVSPQFPEGAIPRFSSTEADEPEELEDIENADKNDEDVVAFDADDRDPLKKVVEANRSE